VPADGARALADLLGRASIVHLRPGGPLDCSDGQVLREWCLAGYGIAWRSTWEVEADIAAGRLETVLDEFAAPPNGIYALFPQRKHLALRVRLWIDFLKHHYAQTDFWQAPRPEPWIAPATGVHLRPAGEPVPHRPFNHISR
jgi:DNA-binding transcriptional LysR family regulator